MARSAAAVKWLTAAAFVAPVLVFAAVLGTRAELWDWRVGHDLLTRQVGLWVAVAGFAAALALVALALRDPRRLAVAAIVALVVSGATLGLLIRHGVRIDAPTPRPDVSSDIADPPGLSSELLAIRAADGAVTPGTPGACPGLEPLDTQVAPGVAGYALGEAGFAVRGFGVGRADGSLESFWFGFGHDAVIRIRPGRTDVRVIAREDRPDGGEACRLARVIRRAMVG